ncbi:MAG: extracellular solute-binding protein [Clostridia bacterium]|nr:extracellular solute-binding protein [Clostridia bacterium]
MKKFLVALLAIAMLLPCFAGFAEDEVVEWDVLLCWASGSYEQLDGDITKHEGIKEYIRRYKEAYGVDVKLNFEILSTNDVYTKFALRVAAAADKNNEDLFDMIWWNVDNYVYPGAPETLYDDGLVIDVTDMLPEYAPKFMETLNKCPKWYQDQYYTPKGRLFLFGSRFDDMDLETGAVEQYTLTGPLTPTWMLEATGFEKEDINTYEDLTEYLHALKDIGVKYPFHGLFNLWMMEWYYGGFGTGQNWYMEGDEVKWGPLTPEWREAVEQLHAWYADGLLNTDFVAYGYNETIAGFCSNEIGIGGFDARLGPIYSGIPGNGAVTALNMLQTTERYLDGKVSTHLGGTGYNYKYYATHFTRSCNDLEEAIRFVDFRYDADMALLAQFGMEGISFEFNEEGRPVRTEEYNNNPKIDAQYVAEFMSGFAMTETSRETLKEQTYQETVFGSWSQPENYSEVFPVQFIKRTAEETEIYNKYYPDFSNYMFECLYDFIINGVTDEGWETYYNTSVELGYNELMEIQQAAYDRFLAIE